jgi:non-canonical purine NTP pyrophosphatase (RdgB/HAM1 family)
MQFVFLTGNQHKADLLTKWLGKEVEHHKVDLDEIQSFDLRAVAEHKVKQAYALLKRPVLVEDVALTYGAMGRLPGPFIKWFLEDLGVDGLCKLADGLESRAVTASICYALYDGEHVEFFENHVRGQVADKPRGEHGFGWNALFIPEGSTKTYAEMDDDEIRPFSHRAPAVAKLKEYLERQEG